MLLLAALLLGQVPVARAADLRVSFGRLGVEEGLSSNWVLALLRDRRGFLWVGTQDGLDRYDGQGFVSYRYEPGARHTLPFPVAGVLFEDSRGRLWVGSRWASEGMAFYNRDLDRFEPLPHVSDPGGLADPRVNAIAEASGGRLWVATPKGVDLVDIDRGTFENFGLESLGEGKGPPRLATALLADRQGTLWVGTTDGLYRLDRQRKRCVRWRGFGAGDATSLDGHRIEAFLEDEAGTLWVATLTGGLFEIDGQAKTIRQHVPRAEDASSLNHLRVRSLALDAAQRLWVGTENGGIGILDRRTGRFARYTPDPFTPGTLGSASIYALLADRQGVMWIGTYDNGLNYFSPMAQRFELVTPSPTGLRDPRVSAFLEDSAGNLWIGTDGGGYCRVDAGTDKYTCAATDKTDSAGALSVLTVAESRDGMLWMGGWGGGLGRLDPRSGRRKRFRHDPDAPASLISNDVWRVRELRSGELLVATRQGTDVFDPASERSMRLAARYPGIADGMTLSLAEARNGDLWIGQNGQVQHIAQQTGQVTTYAHDPPADARFPSGQVFAILEDSRGNVWIGGEGGLRCLPVARPVGSDLTVVAGLPHRVVTNILEDASGNLWVTTHRGLSRLTDAVRDPAQPHLIHFDVHDGLQGSEFTRGAALRARDGRLYFGGPRGFNRFLPEAIALNTDAPPVLLTDLRIFNSSVAPGADGSPLARSITETQTLSLSQDDFVVTFEFAALNLVLPHKNRYAYMLEGLERQWNEAGTRREATYTQLRRGDYRFRVRAANNDGVWNQAGLTLALHVEPRWHEVTWVRGLLALAGVLLVLGTIGWRVRQFSVRERLLTRRVEERTRELHELNEQLEARVTARTAELEAEKQRLSVTLRSIGDAVIATDVEGRVRLMNRVAEQLTGFLADEAQGRKLGEVMPRLDSKTRARRPDATIAMLGEAAPRRLGDDSVLLRRDGGECTVAESAAPIRDHEGRILGMVLAFRDITQQRKLEEQLLGSQKLEALGILAGGIAHDFNNLLAGIFGYLELARLLASDGAKQMDALAKAGALIGRARGLTSQLVTFAKGGEPVVAPLALGEQLAKDAEFALSGSNVTCDLRIADDLWVCHGDKRQIDQVFDNLLLNARQAMPDGGAVSLVAENVSLTAESAVPLPAGRYLRVTVADQGPGIPEEIRARVFEPFFTTKAQGTGLGLATAYSIVRKHGGHIEVASPAGQGARFTVHLPAAEGRAAAPSGTFPRVASRHCRILLLDDEPYVREITQQLLAELGHTVEAVGDGQAAVAAFEGARAAGQPFDLAVLDLTIPGGAGGRAVLARLRALDPALIAIATSGYSADPALANPTAHGFAAKVAKPYTVDDLARVIAQALAAATDAASRR